MGGGDNKAAASTAQSTQQLLEEMQRQRMYSQMGQGLQQAGSIIGQQQPYMQQPAGGRVAVPGAAGQPQGQTSVASALGALFPAAGGNMGGINEAQLAEILSRLGYAG